MTHTPAPWKVTRTGDRVIASDKFIADCDGGAEREDENKANATLIAAAPELLAALQLVDLDSLPDDVRYYVSAAIAKAVGAE